MATGKTQDLRVRATGFPVTPTSRRSAWAGRALSAIPVVALVLSAAMTLARPPPVVAAFTGRYGYPAGVLAPLAAVELACVVLYVIPRTAVLGALLMTAFFGGAVATHVRAREAFVLPILMAALAWAGLYLRDARLHGFLRPRRAR